MILEAKVDKPITLKLSKQGNHFISENERLPLENGVVFGNDHYGFRLLIEKNGEEIEMTYPTQCRIYGVQMTEEQLNVFEENKYIPWKFSQDGKMLSNAIFSDLKRDEWDYVSKTYGVITKEELDELNDYRKCIKRK